MADERVRRRLAAILATDIVGYSRLMHEDEPATLAQLKSLTSELIGPKVAEFGGRIFKTTGDGFLIEFPSAVDAVQHAIDVQEAVAARNDGVAEDRRIALRIGITLGDVIADGEDIYGDGVNVASRLEGIADPGGIVVSLLVRESVRHKLSVDFDDLGEQSVKNIADPVHVYRVRLAAPDRQSGGAASDASFRRPAVAVLPFVNMSGDPEQDYFADGLTEDIITALSLWKSFPVIARNSTFAYKGKSPDIREVGATLGARYVVEGSVRKAGERVRVTAQLINAETGHHVWAERYDREIADIFALQDEITQRIVAIIEPAIEQTELHRIVRKPPTDLAAWEYWLRGYEYIYEGTVEGNEKARELFLRAIALDPHYARAHTGLAYTYVKDVRYLGSENRDELVSRLLETARRAVALDETDSEARTMLARAYVFAGDIEAGLAESRRAVELNPNRAFSNNVMCAMLAFQGKFEESIPWGERAMQLNPTDPQNHLFLTHLALAHLGAGHYEKAADLAFDVVRRLPGFDEPHILLASALGYLGRFEEARTAIAPFEDRAVGFVEGRIFWAADTKQLVLRGLRKAGLANDSA